FSQCYEQTSLIVTTNLPFADWPQIFAEDERLAGALLDRLTHHVHILDITGDSYRLKDSLKKKNSRPRRQEHDRHGNATGNVHPRRFPGGYSPPDPSASIPSSGG
ncbi:MAG: ATP-binding protein, partial [Planctomycetes bacterium]|nr:ATP-binding protein [Planctomycetota bacterium]